MQLRIVGVGLIAIALLAGAITLVQEHNPFNARSQAAAVSGAGSGLVAYWNFDNGSATDASGNGNSNNGTVSGATPVAGKIGGGLSFNGGASVITPLNLTSYPQSACAWIDPAQNAGLGNIFYSPAFQLYSIGGSLQFYNDVNTVYTATDGITNDTWQYVCVTVDTNGDSHLYIKDTNGKAVTASGNVGGVPFASTLSIGNGFKGIIDEVRVYSRVLSDTEIQQLMAYGADNAAPSSPVPTATSIPSWSPSPSPSPSFSPTPSMTPRQTIVPTTSVSPTPTTSRSPSPTLTPTPSRSPSVSPSPSPSPLTPPPTTLKIKAALEKLVPGLVEGTGSGLLGWYTFDENSGTTAADSSGYGNNAVFTNTSTWAPGKLGSALSFNGSSSVITPINITAYPESACAWIYPTDISGYSYIIKSGAFQLFILFNDTLQFYNNKVSLYPQNEFLALNTWQYVCATVDSSNMAVIYSADANHNVHVVASGNVGALAFTSAKTIGDGFKGKIDDVRIYNRALSSDDVVQLYNEGLNGGPTTMYTLTVAHVGNGSVTSNPSGISCGGTCSSSFKVGTPVTLTATPSSGYISTWSGCGSTTNGNTCSVGINDNKNVTVSFIPTPPAPVISSIATSSVTSSSATITWSTDVDSDTKILYGTDNAYGSNTTADNTLVSAHSQTISGLQPGTTYHFQVQSKNSYGILGQSRDLVFTTLSLGPTQPTYVGALGVAPDQINLAWLGSSDESIDGTGTISSYTIYRNGIAIATVPHSVYFPPYHDTEQQAYEDKNVSPGTSYTYTVKAHDSAGLDSPMSDAKTAHTLSGSSALIPANRLIDWTPGVTVGVPGGIPTNRTHLIDVTHAPYNVSNNGGGDASVGINQAIQAAGSGDVVFLPAGTYSISNSIHAGANNSNITIRGAGVGATIINCAAVASTCIGASGIGGTDSNTNDLVTSSVDKGSSVITVSNANANAYNPGQLIWISTKNDTSLPVWSPYGYQFLRGQESIIKAVQGNSLTISPPLMADYDPTATYIHAWQQPLKNVGVEDLTVDGGGRSQVGVGFLSTYGSWIKNVKAINALNYNIKFEDSLNCELRHSYTDSPGGATSQASALVTSVTGCLIEDNTTVGRFTIMVNSSSGNVFAYNLFKGEIDDAHAANHSQYNLWEGNILDSYFEMDGYYQTESELTLFRNFSSTAFVFKRLSRNFNTIGNIVNGYSLGQPNIGNGDSSGFAEWSQHIPWKDWNPDLGPLIRGTLTKTSASTGSVHFLNHADAQRLFSYITKNCNQFDPVTNPTAIGCGFPVGLDWGSGKNVLEYRAAMAEESLDLNTDTLVVSGGYPNDLPSSGTIVGIWPRSEGFQEIDMDVALTLIRKQNCLGVGTCNIPPNEALSGGQQLPYSLYLSNTPQNPPAFFGNLPWPPVDPTNPGATTQNSIPAAYRYNHNGADPAGVTTATTYAFSVNKVGSGTVTSSPAGISCGADCSQSSVPMGTSYTLTAAPSAGYDFTGWSGGGCSGTGLCRVTTGSVVTATFSLTPVVGQGPTLSNISSTNVSKTGATILWFSSPAATTRVIYGVDRAQDGTISGSITSLNPALSSNHIVILSNLTANTHYHYAVISSANGGTSTSTQDYTFDTLPDTNPPPIKPVDTTPPQVSITFPHTLDLLKAAHVYLEAQAVDDSGYSFVQFYVDGQPQGAEQTPFVDNSNIPTTTFSLDWTASVGNHTIYAIAHDQKGNTATSDTVTVRVVAPTPAPKPCNPKIDCPPPTPADTNPPKVTVTPPLPTDKFIAGHDVTLLADATDAESAVAGVQFYVDGVKTGEEQTPFPGESLILQRTFSYNWTAVVGTHSVVASARDTSGNYATSTPISITVQAARGGCGTGGSGADCPPAYGTPPPNTGSNTTTTSNTNSSANTSSSSGGGGGGGGYTPPRPSTSPVAVVVTPITHALSLSSRDPQVTSLQSFLVSQHFLTMYTPGIFDTNTETAVKAFQRTYGIVSAGTAATTGYGAVGPKTRTKLNSLIPTTPVTPTHTPAPLSPSLPTTFTLTQGSTGADVKALQIYLNTHGFIIASSGNGSPGHESTYFGPATKAALTRFQLAKGIVPPLGNFGPVTRTYLAGHP